MDIKTTLKTSVAAGALLALAAPMGAAEAGKIDGANSKTDLTVGGRVNRAIVWVDDGKHDGLFQSAGRSANSEIWLSGTGQLTENVTVAGLLRFDVQKNTQSYGFGSTTGDDVTATAGFADKYETIAFKHKSLGTLTIGFQGEAGDGTVNGRSGGYLAGSSPGAVAGSTEFLTSGGAFSGIAATAQFSNTDPGDSDNIRYDSPSFNGLSISASTHQGGGWDVAARYSATFSGVTLKLAGHVSQEDISGGTDNWGGSVVVEHSSGLRVNAAYGEAETEGQAWDAEYLRIGGGYSAKISSLGTTDFTVMWYNNEGVAAQNREADHIEVGVRQSLDAIGGYAGISYNNISLDDNTGTNYQDIDVVYFETGFNF